MIAASLRGLPGALRSQLKRAVVVTATLDSRNDLFASIVAWLNDQRFGQRSRWFTVVQAPPAVAEDEADVDDTPRLHDSPAPGFHLFWYRGRLMCMRREIAMNLQVVLRPAQCAGRRGRAGGPDHRADDQPPRDAGPGADPAGRIDLAIDLGNATAAQLKGLLLRFHPEAAECVARLVADYPPRRLSPAQIQQILITADNLDEAEAGLRAA